MKDLQILRLLYVLLALTSLNLMATLYFQFTKPTSSSGVSASSEVPIQVSDQEATAFAREIVDLYNDKKGRELYLKFDDAARLQISELEFSKQIDNLYTLFGGIESFTYLNTEVASQEREMPYVVLNYQVKLSSAKFNSGKLKVTALRRNGRLGLFEFVIRGEND